MVDTFFRAAAMLRQALDEVHEFSGAEIKLPSWEAAEAFRKSSHFIPELDDLGGRFMIATHVFIYPSKKLEHQKHAEVERIRRDIPVG